MNDEESARQLVDAAALIAEFHERWSVNGFRSWSGKQLERLADSAHGQPDTQGRNPYWDIIRQFPLDDVSSPWGYHAVAVSPTPGLSKGYPQLVTRHDLVWTYAWAIPTPADIRWLTQRLAGRSVVEIGAGTGYWAWQLSQADVDVLAFDIRTGSDDNPWCQPIQYHPVHQGGPDKASEYPTRALLLCWPPYSSPMAADALRVYNGDVVVYVGESSGGCCADDEFFMLLDKDWDEIGVSPQHVTYSAIHCSLTVYRRKGAEVRR
jgi:hypothetical protein